MRWFRNLLLAAACVLLAELSIPYEASYFGVTAEASLAHFKLGLLLAVAMLARDPWSLRFCVAAVAAVWFSKVGVSRETWHFGLVNMFITYGLLRWTARRLGWPRNVPGDVIRVADVPRFMFYGALVLPVANTVLNHSFQWLMGSNWGDINAALQVFFARYFGVSILTLPIVIIAAYGERVPSLPWWRTAVPWRAILVGVLLPTLAIELATRFGWDVGAGLQALLDYRLIPAALMVFAVLRLDPGRSMPMLIMVHLLFATALAHRVDGTEHLPDVIGMFRIALECLMLEVLLVVLFLHSREREAAAAQHERDSRTEPMTGLRNLAALRRRAAQGPLPTLGFLLLDRTERVTASLGLHAESQLMRAVAHHLSGHAEVFHIGTGRLALILAGSGAPRDPAARWAALLDHVNAMEFSWRGNRVRVLPYLGVAGPDTQREPLDERLLHAANSAYEAQRRGELRSVSARTDLATRASRRGALRLSATVLSRIRQGQVELHFQRIVPLAVRDAGDVLAGEVLCRLRDEDGRLLYPQLFMGELQADRRASELDLAVVSELDRWLRVNRARLPETCRISVNVTGQSLASREFARKLLNNLDNFALPLSMLCFEVTETAAITHVSDSMRLLAQLRERGCQIALDDFGVGFQSFERLKQLPITVVKIDGSFVREMIRSPRDHALIQAAVHAAHAFGATTVAEFVEDAATAAALRDLRVDWAQGYHYGRPEPLDNFLSQETAATRLEA